MKLRCEQKQSPQTALVLAAQAGDQTAFETLVKTYQHELQVDCCQLFALLVLDVEDERIASVVGFLEVSSLACFALPPTLPEREG